MTVIAFLLSGLAGWAYLETVGRVILPGVTVWIAWYFVVLTIFSHQAFRSKNEAIRAAAIVMICSFLAAHVIWNASYWPIAAQSLKNIVVASTLLLVGYGFRSRIVFLAAFLHLLIVGVGFMADLGFMFGGKRPMQFLAWSFPDVSAGLQHAALMVLSLGCHRHQNARVGDYPRHEPIRIMGGMATMAKVHKDQGEAA